jgi:hypothetical protein
MCAPMLPAGRPFPRAAPTTGRLPTPSDAHVVTPIHVCGARPGRRSRRGTPPLFQASCASTDAVGVNGRGTCFRHPARGTSESIPD